MDSGGKRDVSNRNALHFDVEGRGPLPGLSTCGCRPVTGGRAPPLRCAVGAEEESDRRVRRHPRRDAGKAETAEPSCRGRDPPADCGANASFVLPAERGV
jgi:hypothetical protein